MKLSRRKIMVLYILLVFILPGILFWPFVLNEIIYPISLAIWFFLRLFVLSIAQKYYWTAIIFAVVFFAFRLFLPSHSEVSSEITGESNKTLSSIVFWRRLFIPTESNTSEDKILKMELSRLLVALYRTKQHTSVDYRLHQALKSGEIPLPENVHAFVFPEEPRKSQKFMKRFFLFIRKAPRVWIRRWSGLEAAEHHQMVDAVLSFMELSLEMKNDNKEFNPHEH